MALNDDQLDLWAGTEPLEGEPAPNLNLDSLVAEGLIDASWAVELRPAQAELDAIQSRLVAEVEAGRSFLPAAAHIMRAFAKPLDEVRVLIVGQDPYPTPGYGIGLSFAVDRSVWPLPRSLANIYKELESDLGISPASHGDLSAWSDQGVLLLNRVLTLAPGEAGSHRRWGWEKVTELAIRAIVARNQPLVAILWGKDAEGLVAMLGQTPTVISAHPSPLSASRGFFGSQPFSKANAALIDMGAMPINWKV